jgi:succinyl-CoA synthetase alpha subunit
VIATPAAAVAGLIAELGARGCRAAVIISAGFEGDDAASAARRQAVLDAARPHLLRIVGPNCLGLALAGKRDQCELRPGDAARGVDRVGSAVRRGGRSGSRLGPATAWASPMSSRSETPWT